jgi:hypothetical protein
VPESPAEELARRQRRYAVKAVVFIGCFTLAALLHSYTVVALLLCVVAVVTLVWAVIGANVRSPRRRAAPGQIVNEQRQLDSRPAKRPSEK